MRRIRNRASISPHEVLEPLFEKEPGTSKEIRMPKVSKWRFIARSIMLAAQRRKERLLENYRSRRQRSAGKIALEKEISNDSEKK